MKRIHFWRLFDRWLYGASWGKKIVVILITAALVYFISTFVSVQIIKIYDLNNEKELTYLKVKFLNKSNTCLLEAFFEKIEIYKIEPLSLDKKSNENVEFKLYGSYRGVTYFKPNN